MIFLCFTVKDRNHLINDYSHYISNFGVDIWYDRKNIFLGDNRIINNIDNGIANPNIKYVILFYSKNFDCGKICKEEYKIIEKRYYKKEIHVFPVFLDDSNLIKNDKYKLCYDLVYKKINSNDDFYALTLHIMAKITFDELKNCTYKTIIDYIRNNDSIYSNLLIEYENITKTNYQLRIGILYSIFMSIKNKIILKKHHIKTINYIFHQNCIISLGEEKREIQVFENIILYGLNFIHY